MAGILQSENLPEINNDIARRIDSLVDTTCDYSSQAVYFPVRHHSPACSFHLKAVIRDYKPDCILIEGPSDANELIDILVRSEAPLAIYCSYSDKKGIISDNKEDYKCYYPFLDCSPELTALREAARIGIHSAFIDLAYCDILKSQSEGCGLRTEEASYNDDYLISRSKYIKELCGRLGMRSFDELWEKYFEIQVAEQDTKTYFRTMLTYCMLSRDDTSDRELAEEGCFDREKFMAYYINEAKKSYSRILVVTGGFHTCALPDLLRQEIGLPKNTIKNDQKLYPIAYSFEAADMLSGYASGMPSPGFYSSVWKLIEEGEKPADAYRQAVLNYMVSTARKLRSKGESISAYDEICAYDMALGLADIRSKKAPGLYELTDSVLSCFVKGEYCISTDNPMRILRQLVTGNGVGKLCKDAPEPPIVSDFENRCKKLGLKTGTTQSKELILDIFSSKKHRETAAFFHRLCFLDIPYAVCVKGIDLRTGKNKNIVREIWKCKWSTQTHSQLIDRSVFGSTVEEACIRVLMERLGKAESAQSGASYTVSAFEMGLDIDKGAIVETLHQLIVSDGSFVSLAGALRQLVSLNEKAALYRIDDTSSLEALVRRLGQKLISLVSSVANVSDDDFSECANACILLYRLSGSEALAFCREELLDAFRQLAGIRPINAAMEGTVHGLLYGSDTQWREMILTACEGYFGGTGEELKKSMSYLRGLFSTARDLVLIDGYFIETIDRMLCNAEDEFFMQILPEMRLAFGYFTPSETDRIAEQAAALHGAKRRDITNRVQVMPALYSYGKKLDIWAVSQLEGEAAENG